MYRESSEDSDTVTKVRSRKSGFQPDPPTESTFLTPNYPRGARYIESGHYTGYPSIYPQSFMNPKINMPIGKNNHVSVQPSNIPPHTRPIAMNDHHQYYRRSETYQQPPYHPRPANNMMAQYENSPCRPKRVVPNYASPPMPLLKNVPLETYCVRHKYRQKFATIAAPHGLINDRIQKLASDILKTYMGEKELFMVACLPGARIFHGVLLHQMEADLEMTDNSDLTIVEQVMRVRLPTMEDANPNINPTQPSKLDITAQSNISLEGKPVLLVMDRIGQKNWNGYMTFFDWFMNEKKPSSINIVSLLVEPDVSQFIHARLQTVVFSAFICEAHDDVGGWAQEDMDPVDPSERNNCTHLMYLSKAK